MIKQYVVGLMEEEERPTCWSTTTGSQSGCTYGHTDETTWTERNRAGGRVRKVNIRIEEGIRLSDSDRAHSRDLSAVGGRANDGSSALRRSGIEELAASQSAKAVPAEGVSRARQVHGGRRASACLDWHRRKQRFPQTITGSQAKWTGFQGDIQRWWHSWRFGRLPGYLFGPHHLSECRSRPENMVQRSGQQVSPIL